VRTHALDLLRSGECVTLPTLLSRVLEDVKAATEAQRASEGDAKDSNGKNGKGGVQNGVGKNAGVEGLAVPKEVIEEGIKVTRECLESVCEIEA
jgi:hypothetical protein